MAKSSRKLVDEQTKLTLLLDDEPPPELSRGVKVANSHFSKIRAKTLQKCQIQASFPRIRHIERRTAFK
uniref:Uncharacterized protein n=1 Tax=Romanomermis culicivorax TaxID=13658 RepID=A0A915KLT6_ROMCU